MKNKIMLQIVFISLIFCNEISAQWVKTNLPNNLISSLAVSGENLFAGTEESVFLSTNNGENWVDLNSGFGATTFEVADTNIYAGSTKGVYLSTNTGKDWERILDSLLFVSGLAVVGPNLLAGGDGGIFLSDDNGASWAPVDSGLPFPSFDGHYLVRQNINGTNSTDVFVATAAAGQPGESIYRSIDNGLSWTQVGNGLPNFFYFEIKPLASLPNSNGSTTILTSIHPLCQTCTQGVYRSIDNGLNWEPADTLMKQISSFAVSSSYASNYLFAGTYLNGVFLSTNSGTSWTQVNSGLADLDIQSLAITDTYLFAGTHSGVWRRPLSEMITDVENRSNYNPSTFTLEQNYPNPFNPSTTIKFQVPNSSFVNLKVYDILGNEVATLVNEEKPSGTYEVSFDAKGLSSGIYFYKLQAGSFVETRKMILMK